MGITDKIKGWVERRNLRYSAGIVAEKAGRAGSSLAQGSKHAAREIGTATGKTLEWTGKQIADELAYKKKLARMRAEKEIPHQIRQKYGVTKYKKGKTTYEYAKSPQPQYHRETTPLDDIGMFSAAHTGPSGKPPLVFQTPKRGKTKWKTFWD